MRIVESKDAGPLLRKLVDRGTRGLASVDKAVQRIVADVRRGGDKALLRHAKKLDGIADGAPLRVSAEEMQKAWDNTPEPLRAALEAAAKSIRQFAEWQKPQSWQREWTPGVRVGQLVRALDSVGCYAPGGRYPLPSTILMTVIPAQVAGVERIVVVSPKPRRETLAAAGMLGVKEFYRIGGAQAVAALAYGTETIPRVDKIVGPGNLYVTAAKKQVAFDCAIDMLAGPTEVLIYSDTSDPACIAADLIAQAEHDPESSAVFLTTKSELASSVADEVASRCRKNPAAQRALDANGVILVATSRDEALEIANRIAPEHITVDAGDAEFIRHAGSIFVGEFSPQPVGDYCSGPNHVLPTGGAARSRGGLSVNDFLKAITVQELTSAGVKRVAETAMTLAAAEGLRGHAEAVQVRLNRTGGRRANA
jgi:histidinol dehydrogenase